MDVPHYTTNGHIVAVGAPDIDRKLQHAAITDPQADEVVARLLAAMPDQSDMKPCPMTMPEWVPCSHCHGAGATAETDCDVCDGDGDLHSGITGCSYTCPACEGDGELTPHAPTRCVVCNGVGMTPYPISKTPTAMVMDGVVVDRRYVAMVGAAALWRRVVVPDGRRHLYWRRGDAFGLIAAITSDDDVTGWRFTYDTEGSKR